jgi:hypothetical protein
MRDVLVLAALAVTFAAGYASLAVAAAFVLIVGNG